MMAGKSKQGVCRTYLRFKDFTAKIKGKYVDSATLTMYETGSSQSGQTIEARRVTAVSYTHLDVYKRQGFTGSLSLVFKMASSNFFKSISAGSVIPLVMR